MLVLALSWLDDASDVWQHLWDTMLLRILGNTLYLVVGVAIGVLLLGVSSAWMVSRYQFVGRGFFQWALFLPLAVPGYVLAFVMLDLFDFAGPVQSFLRRELDFFQGTSARSPLMVVITLSLVLYPYVYMMARVAFSRQGQRLEEQARILGYNARQTFWKVTLPMARPAIVAGTALALMEALADFGAVAVFNFDTFTTAIYRSWYGLFNLEAAAQLASLLLLIVLAGLMLERYGRGRSRYDGQHGGEIVLTRPGPLRAWGFTLFCSLILLFAFVLPGARLVYWVATVAWKDFNSGYFAVMGNTLWLAAVAAVIMVSLALLVGLLQRLYGNRSARWAVQLSTLGYAMPGSVLAVGIMLSFAWLDHQLVNLLSWQPIFMGSVLALFAAYSVRFFAVAHGPVEAAYETVKPSLVEAARTLGAGPWRAVSRVWFPLMTPGLLSALLLVSIDVMKEMPATLLLRPFGWDTLAVRVFAMTAEGEWSRAALPSLTLVLVGLLPVLLLLRRMK